MARSARGFTLVEMVVAITLIGILAMVATPMLQLPMSAYIDSVRRANANAELNVALSKMGDDLAQALPGSVRATTSGGVDYLEFVHVRAVGRYRAQAGGGPICPAATCMGGGNRDVLRLNAPDNCFATLGPLEGTVAGVVPAPLVGSDFVVVNPGQAPLWAVYNPAPGLTNKSLLQSLPAPPPPPVANGRRCIVVALFRYTDPTGGPSSSTPRPSIPGRPFYVVDTPVTYVCNRNTRTLTRVWGYAMTAIQPTAFGAAPNAPVATGIGGCSFVPTPPALPRTSQLVSVWLRFTHSSAGNVASESVDGFSQFSVREAP